MEQRIEFERDGETYSMTVGGVVVNESGSLKIGGPDIEEWPDELLGDDPASTDDGVTFHTGREAPVLYTTSSLKWVGIHPAGEEPEESGESE